ncbi:hypothetical protein AAHA92_05664 [Salvia divinorum]|uniref:Uncharacterized protein n=1 Tax=Salvia divinorum TaxID=28513 RepID=A0ABD1I371_SALDI
MVKCEVLINHTQSRFSFSLNWPQYYLAQGKIIAAHSKRGHLVLEFLLVSIHTKQAIDAFPLICGLYILLTAGMHVQESCDTLRLHLVSKKCQAKNFYDIHSCLVTKN